MSGVSKAGGISASVLLQDLRESDREFALLDVREEGRFGQAHILTASSLPLSRLELEIARLVPLRDTDIVIYDDDDGLAARAGARLSALGYSNVTILEGGLAAWIAAGHFVYDGLNTPSKALGVFAQRELAIPEIGLNVLAQLCEHGETPLIVDCRPFSEYQNGTIPGSINCPGAALAAYRAMDVESRGISNAEETLVVHCAGRTRGLAGVQTLIDNGYQGRIFALRDGTMGWQLSGRVVEKNAGRSLLDARRAAASAGDLARAEVIRTAAGIDLVDAGELKQMLNDRTRTLYLFDIREKREYDTGHIYGARNIAGGQLVQNLDMHVATRGARIVVSDRDGIAASSIALWLRRMGWRDIFVARIDDGGHEIVTDTSGTAEFDMVPNTVRYISANKLKELADAGSVTIVDLASSRDYRKGHITGAWFVVRSRLPAVLPRLPRSGSLVLTSPDGHLAAWAAGDEPDFPGELYVLKGGTGSWQAAGYELSADLERMIDCPDDIVQKPSELPEGPARDEAMRTYLGGSEELLAKVEREGILKFAALPVA